MPSDLYVPRGSHPYPSGYIPRVVLSGVGAPTSTAGVQPDAIYIDISTGDFYEITNGAWVLLFQSGGGGGGTGVFSSGSDLDPNSNVTGSPGDIYVSAISQGGDGSVWFKITGTDTNTGWE